jgi:hypothetical protein
LGGNLQTAPALFRAEKARSPGPFLHGINTNAIPFFFGLVFAPASAVISFGVGVYGLAVLAVIVLLLVRDPLLEGERGADPFPPGGQGR